MILLTSVCIWHGITTAVKYKEGSKEGEMLENIALGTLAGLYFLFNLIFVIRIYSVVSDGSLHSKLAMQFICPLVIPKKLSLLKRKIIYESILRFQFYLQPCSSYQCNFIARNKTKNIHIESNSLQPGRKRHRMKKKEREYLVRDQLGKDFGY